MVSNLEEEEVVEPICAAFCRRAVADMWGAAGLVAYSDDRLPPGMFIWGPPKREPVLVVVAVVVVESSFE